MTLQELQDHLVSLISALSDEDKITTINTLKVTLHALSPFSSHPVDCVLWLPTRQLQANDYNPNTMAPPETRLLYTSLVKDGFTQPIVASQRDDDCYIIVDGAHRHALSQKRAPLRKTLGGYNPVVLLDADTPDKSHRIATTVRHNRARGRHQVNAMSDIVKELSRLGWDDLRISEELGMEADEVLRLKQISGLTELFLDREFSQAWTVK
ncbi:MAG: IbrB-like domain-containing protein [Enterobacterales bacterium]|uniref:IbrB-like domain-containing protein n=1 Tax=Serratia sp. (in: enterobacteria) TaxID=616 RepID=UPI003F34D319